MNADSARPESGRWPAAVARMKRSVFIATSIDGHGARGTIRGFHAGGLIDGLILMRIPRLLGGGIARFDALGRDVRLRRVATRACANGLVQSRYTARR
jgi:dihydrofolate reductase